MEYEPPIKITEPYKNLYILVWFRFRPFLDYAYPIYIYRNTYGFYTIVKKVYSVY
jgi:hypothetical protein